MALCWSLDKVGPIVRHVDDAAPVLAAINGASPGDPASVTMPFHADSSRSARGLRVGYDPKWFADDETGPLEQSAIDALRDAGCDVKPIQMPDWPWDSLLTILLAEATAAFESLTRSNRDDELTWQAPEAWPNTFRQSWFIPAPELVQADRFRRRCMELYSEQFDDLDAMIGSSFGGGVLITTNCTGHPSLTVPVGLKDSGSPHAVTPGGATLRRGHPASTWQGHRNTVLAAETAPASTRLILRAPRPFPSRPVHWDDPGHRSGSPRSSAPRRVPRRPGRTRCTAHQGAGSAPDRGR